MDVMWPAFTYLGHYLFGNCHNNPDWCCDHAAATLRSLCLGRPNLHEQIRGVAHLLFNVGRKEITSLDCQAKLQVKHLVGLAFTP